MSNRADDLDYIENKFPFTHGEKENLKLWLGDLAMWGFPSLKKWWTPPSDKLKGKDLRKAALKPIEKKWRQAKEEGPQWTKEFPVKKSDSVKFHEISDNRNILGTCPVASEKTRCCNLQTLDAVFRCGFDCTYCSIQSFYSQGKISFHGNLREKLENLKLEPERLYHIGTGQSSDSLMWGNYETGPGQGLLDELMRFARQNPNVILELKSKSDNISWLLENRQLIPYNVIFTWSLNPPALINHEERLTAPLEKRLQAARTLSDLNLAVGFHFHPMVIYKGWQNDYTLLFDRVKEMFTPSEVVQVSLGTLTFIKPVLKKIRNREFASQILRMPMEESAGKFTYPFELKEDLFIFAYNSFKSWHRDVFFYLCMEDKKLWKRVFQREYPTNEDFEKDMLLSYLRKLKMIG